MAVIVDRALNGGALVGGGDAYPAIACTPRLLDGGNRVQDDVEEALVELVRVAENQRHVARLELHGRGVLQTVGADRQGIPDALVDVHGGRLPGRPRPGEILQATHDRPDAIDSLEVRLENARAVLEEEGRVHATGVSGDLFDGKAAMDHGQNRFELPEVVLHALGVAADEPQRIVDFVRHARGEHANACQFLRLQQPCLRPLEVLVGVLELLRALCRFGRPARPGNGACDHVGGDFEVLPR